MRVLGERADGALAVDVGGGIVVVLRGVTCSPPSDADTVWALGPWREVSHPDVRALTRQLDVATTVPLERFVRPPEPWPLKPRYDAGDVPTFQTLVDQVPAAQHCQGGEHPFTWCMENVIPAMEREGKAPADPEAFCSWWKHEGPGSS
jgi:hypothetical protein